MKQRGVGQVPAQARLTRSLPHSLDHIRTTTAVFLCHNTAYYEPGRPAECPCFDLFRSGQVIACTKRRRACVLSRALTPQPADGTLARANARVRRAVRTGGPCVPHQTPEALAR